VDPSFGVLGVGVLLLSFFADPLGLPRFLGVLEPLGVAVFCRLSEPRSVDGSVLSRATLSDLLLVDSYCCTRSSTCGDDDGDDGRVLSVVLPLGSCPLTPLVDSGAGLDSDEATDEARLMRLTVFLRPRPDFFGGGAPKLYPVTEFCGPAVCGSVHSGIFSGGDVPEVIVRWVDTLWCKVKSAYEV
jgi:hypothetical protein